MSAAREIAPEALTEEAVRSLRRRTTGRLGSTTDAASEEAKGSIIGHCSIWLSVMAGREDVRLAEISAHEICATPGPGGTMSKLGNPVSDQMREEVLKREVSRSVDAFQAAATPGDAVTKVFDGHRFRIAVTEESGLHTGRRRYRVECEICEEVVHEATTGPGELIMEHLRFRRSRNKDDGASRVVIERDDEFAGLKVGDTLIRAIDGHELKISKTGQAHIAGRNFYRVECATCHELVHCDTSTPDKQIKLHLAPILSGKSVTIAVRSEDGDEAIVLLSYLLRECKAAVSNRPRDGSPPMVAMSADVVRAVAQYALTLSRAVAASEAPEYLRRIIEASARVGGDGFADAVGSRIYPIHSSVAYSAIAPLGLSSLPARKEWDPSIPPPDCESSDYVDGWNDALEEVTSVIRSDRRHTRDSEAGELKTC